MTSSFLDRNKKKNLLAAALLLLLRRRREALLLLALVLASLTFLGPSSLLLRLPGGEHLVAGIARLAEAVGADVSEWGLGLSGRRSYGDLAAAFRAAKAAGAGAAVGWGPFFVGRVRGAGAGRGSLDLVRGRREDLATGGGAGRGGEGGASSGSDARSGSRPDGGAAVQGIVDPRESRPGRGSGAVELTPEDQAGAGPREARLAGGAYIAPDFFSGPSAAGRRAGDLARAGLASVPPAVVPRSRAAGGEVGRLSAFRGKAVAAQAAKGLGAAGSLDDGRAFARLAEGWAVDKAAVQDCPTCAGETQISATGAVYDGHGVSEEVLGGAQPPTDPVAPPSVEEALADAKKALECLDLVKACQAAQIGPMQRMGQLQSELTSLMGRMGGACGDPCKCGPCNDLKNKINGICNGELKSTMDQLSRPCSLPSYCAAFAPPPAGQVGTGPTMCKTEMGQCGCGGNLFCSLGCLF